MSTIYNTEPQPTGSVILHTSQGELAVEIFAKQTPLTGRNFLQHCLDGYYDNTVFHRLVPGFILQGGDPTGTGNGGESIYDGGAFSGDLDPWPMEERRGGNAGPTGANFKDEFHSRLKFNRRGLLGMANEGTVDSNGSQFFFTLGKAEELNGKNTMFGRIAGDTIYNLAKMGEAEVAEGGDRPLYSIKITSVEILVNPFADMKKRERIAPRTEKTVALEKKQKKRKGGKQLLSFGDEEGDGDDLPVIKKAKFDTRIVMDTEEQANASPPKKARAKEATAKKEDKAAKKPPVPAASSPDETPPPRGSPPASKSKQGLTGARHKGGRSPDPEAELEPKPAKKKSLLEQTNEEIAALKASMKRPTHVEHVGEKKKSALEQMIPENATRGRKRRPGGNNTAASDEQRTLDMLRAFQSRLDQAPAPKETADSPATGNVEEKNPNEAEDGDEGQVCDLHFIANCQSCQSWDNQEVEENSDNEGWLGHTLSFQADKLGKDLSYRKKAEEELVVIDPREKARALKEEKRAGREARGGSGRAWDQARNAEMARTAAVAGRGAK